MRIALAKIENDYYNIKDIRDISYEDLKEVDAIIHLAALSNDPLGEFEPMLTEDINYKAFRLAGMAKDLGVKDLYMPLRKVCMVFHLYEELDEDNSKNPITAYAKTKWLAEIELKKIFQKILQLFVFVLQLYLVLVQD